MFRRIIIVMGMSIALASCGTINTDEWDTGAKAFAGVVVGGVSGMVIGGPIGMVAGAAVGGTLACCVVSITPKDEVKKETESK